MREDGPWHFLEIVRGQHVVVGRDERLEIAPGATGDQPQGHGIGRVDGEADGHAGRATDREGHGRRSEPEQRERQDQRPRARRQQQRARRRERHEPHAPGHLPPKPERVRRGPAEDVAAVVHSSR